MRLRNRSATITVASIVLTAAIFAWLAWQRRWIADDGLIYTRIVRQILDGNGPVFNAFERAEANTSTLWPWVVALFGTVIRSNLAYLAVLLGGAFSIAGLALAMDATRRWHRMRGSDAMLVPCAALVVLAVYPFWDYATSGLETGLTTLWLGVAWWALVTLSAERRRENATAFVFGLGPLVRPDLALVSAVFLGAAWLLVRPTRRRTLILVAIAIALPFAYEIFRAGFYGTLVPLPAIAKSATHSMWGRGVDYVRDFAHPYKLWIPVAVGVALVGYVLAKQSLAKRDRILLGAPLVAGALLLLYVVRVGGDFMHARMCLPPLFLALAPGLLVPLRRVTAPALVVLATWAVITGYALNDRKSHSTSLLITDERYGYVLRTGKRNPIDERPFIRAQGLAATLLAEARAAGRRIMISENAVTYALSPALRESVVYIAGRLGSGGSLAPIEDGIAADVLGLANPLGARITMTYPTEPPGHQKLLPWPWLLADFADPAQDGNAADATPAVLIRAARHAMSCGELAELLASVREPMSLSRFWRNLTGSIRRTRLVIPSDPIDAERAFCGAAAQTPKVLASSSYERDRWSIWNVVDGRASVPGESLGFSTNGAAQNHTEWIELQFPTARSISKVVLTPRNDPGNEGVGFPLDFVIQTWDGTRWIDRVTQTGFELSRGTTFTWSPATTTDRIRVLATRLQTFGIDAYVMQLSEIEAFP